LFIVQRLVFNSQACERIFFNTGTKMAGG
jgi:hypothetical protein